MGPTWIGPSVATHSQVESCGFLCTAASGGNTPVGSRSFRHYPSLGGPDGIYQGIKSGNRFVPRRAVGTGGAFGAAISVRRAFVRSGLSGPISGAAEVIEAIERQGWHLDHFGFDRAQSKNGAVLLLVPPRQLTGPGTYSARASCRAADLWAIGAER